MNQKRIYLSSPDLSENERKLLNEAFDSNWITTSGPALDAFEDEMCAYLDIGHAVALSSGTAALHLALANLEVGTGDIVLCSDLTFVASANPIRYLGAEPVFIDSDRDSWNMDPNALEAALVELRSKSILPRAAIVVDLYGQSANFTRITDICARFHVPVIEDAAEALGATIGNKKAGTNGVMGILSFNGNKIITTSGGGMLVSENEAYIKKARHLATQACDPFPYYQHTSIGYNYRLSNLLAAIGSAQLMKIESKVECRRRINAFYKHELQDIPGIAFMPEAAFGRANCWLTCITIDPELTGVTNETVRLYLEKQNIQSRQIWKPMHLQPIYKEFRVFGGAVSEDLFNRGLCLPSGCGMKEDDLGRVVSGIRAALESRGNGFSV